MSLPKMDFVPEPAFGIQEYQGRLTALEQEIEERGLDGLIIHIPENVVYISGFHTPGYYYPQLIVVKPGEKPLIVLRALEALSLPVRSWFDDDQLITFADNERPIAKLDEALRRLGLDNATVGVEKHGWFFTLAMYEELSSSTPNLNIIDAGRIVEGLRKVKSSAEIVHIREACRIAEVGIQAGIDNFELNMTEAELSAHVHKAMIEQGCEYVGLPVFLMSGHRQLAPHSVWSKDKKIVAGENIFLEVAGTVHRYAGALFRTLVAGRPTARNKENMDVAIAMLEASMEALRPGVTSDAVNKAVGVVAEKNGVLIRKRCGYSMGLNFAPDWGEGLFLELADDDKTVIEAGMVFHLPEAVRRPGEPLVATSETVLVTESGCEPLTTRFGRGLIEV